MSDKLNNFKKRIDHEDVAADFRQQIRSGVLKPGQRMPSLSELKVIFGLPQPAIMRAQDLLEREGLIVRRQGSGTYVSDTTEWFGMGRRPEVSTVTGKSLMILTSYEGMSDVNQHAPGWAMRTSLGIIQQSHQNDLHAVLLKTSHVTSTDLDQILRSQPFGIIVSDHRKDDIHYIQDLLSKLARSRVPIVSLSDIDPDVDCVVSDQALGAFTLTEWLIARGRTRIVNMLPATDKLTWVASRRAGYEDAMDRHGLLKRVALIPDGSAYIPATEAEFEIEARRCLGYLAEHMMGTEACDAIMVPSDGSVSAVARACRLIGKVPDRDVLIVGYDNYWQDTVERRWEATPPAATVDKHNQRIGQELVKLVVERAEGRLPDERQIRLIAPELVVVKQDLPSAR